MRKMFFAALTAVLFIPFTPALGQNGKYSDERLQTQLDSLYLLEREARNSGEENKYAAEIKQLQTLIKTERERMQEEGLKGINENTAPKNINENTDFMAKITSFLTGDNLLDNLIILMGAIAVLALIFLIFIRLFLTIFSKNKKTAVKNKIPPKNANVLKEIDRYKKKTPEKVQNQENVIYSLKELANRNQPEITTVIEVNNKPRNDEYPQKSRAADLKSGIIRRFDAGEDITKIAHDFNISQDQIAMILRLAGRN